MSDTTPESQARAKTAQLIRDYYAAFNKGDSDGMLAFLTDDVIHDVNQGERREGKDKFKAFNARMDHNYKEELKDIVVLVSKDATRAAAEFNVHGTYKNSEEGLPPAKGQTYRLPAGAFFEVKGGKVSRISNFYNLQDWLKQVAG